MSEEQSFLQAMRVNRRDPLPRLIYADWLEDRGDLRADYLRIDLALDHLPPDHAQRFALEDQWSQLRSQVDMQWQREVMGSRRKWLREIAGSARSLRWNTRSCTCYRNGQLKATSRLRLHADRQDTRAAGWRRLVELIDQAADDGREEFAPFRELEPVERTEVITLPPTIAKLTRVKRLRLANANLVRLPPEIGQMQSLEELTFYDSHVDYPRLHWFPFEIGRCKNLRDSYYSPWSLYGNYRAWTAFPQLTNWRAAAGAALEAIERVLARNHGLTRACSICKYPFRDLQQHRVWISLPVAGDAVPLLVNACSQECIDRLPTPSHDYLRQPHRGEITHSPARSLPSLDAYTVWISDGDGSNHWLL